MQAKSKKKKIPNVILVIKEMSKEPHLMHKGCWQC